MSITLETNGVNYDGFTSVKVFRSFQNLASAFNFTSVSSEGRIFPIAVGQTCKVYVEGLQVIDGFIEKINIAYNSGDHIITIEGRDKTCDLIDSTINSRVIYNPPITLKKVIENAINVLGITGMQVFQEVPIAPFKASEIQSAKIGESFFKFLEKLCKMRQVIMTTDGEGNVVLDQSSKVQLKTVLLSKINEQQNNVLQSNSMFDFTERFGTYSAYSQGNAIAYADIPQTAQQLTSKRGFTKQDPEVRKTRQYNFIAEKSTSDQDLQNRATWEANIRRAKSKIYNCTVQGFIATQDNQLWEPNLLVRVDDDFSNTQGLFLIKDVTYSLRLGEGEGHKTDLSLVVKDAFTLQAEQDQRDARVNPQGKGNVV